MAGPARIEWDLMTDDAILNKIAHDAYIINNATEGLERRIDEYRAARRIMDAAARLQLRRAQLGLFSTSP